MSTPLHILLVEDNEDDIAAVRLAFQRRRIANPIHIARDGERALELLRATGDDALPRPLLLMVDVHLPKLSGPDLVRAIRADDALKELPVYVLTSTEKVRDEMTALGVIGYGVKSEIGADFDRVLARMGMGVRLVEFV